MLIAQITDSHVDAPGVLAFGRIDARAALRRIGDELGERAAHRRTIWEY